MLAARIMSFLGRETLAFSLVFDWGHYKVVSSASQKKVRTCDVQIFIYRVPCLVTMTPRRPVLPPLSLDMQAGISSLLHKHTHSSLIIWQRILASLHTNDALTYFKVLTLSPCLLTSLGGLHHLYFSWTLYVILEIGMAATGVQKTERAAAESLDPRLDGSDPCRSIEGQTLVSALLALQELSGKRGSSRPVWVGKHGRALRRGSFTFLSSWCQSVLFVTVLF